MDPGSDILFSVSFSFILFKFLVLSILQFVTMIKWANLGKLSAVSEYKGSMTDSTSLPSVSQVRSRVTTVILNITMATSQKFT